MQRITPRPDEDVCAAVARDVSSIITERVRGRVSGVNGLSVHVAGFPVPISTSARIHTRQSGTLDAEVIGLRGGEAILSVLGEPRGVSAGDVVECAAEVPGVPVGLDLLGRVVDGRGAPLDGRPPPHMSLRYPLVTAAPPAMQRVAITRPLGLGVRAIDALLTAGRGQRLGIFAGTGVGKSVLMGMICRHTQADVNVVALIGERGREVGDFIRDQLGPEGLARSVVVVCTSDEAPSVRVRTCMVATAIAEYFRDRGLDVLLMMDSLTRFAMAQRQLGLASGEPPTSKGYPPSVYAMLPRLLERAGSTVHGSITGIYTVLVEGDDIGEPLADAVRGILDGHIWLSRGLANRGHYPAVDVLNSISRVAVDVVDAEHTAAARAVRRVLATWQDIEDLVNIGAYVKGVSREYDLAVATRDAVLEFLRQDRHAASSFDENAAALRSLHGTITSIAAGLG